MRKLMVILINCVFILSLNCCVLADNNIKLYINNTEIKDSIIVDNENVFVSLSDLINNIGGSYNWNKDTNEVDIIYNDVTYSFKHNNKWNAFPNNNIDSDKMLGSFILSVTNNPKNHIIKDIDHGLIHYGYDKFNIYIFNNKLYFRCDKNFEKILNLLDYKYSYTDNINIDKVNYNFDDFVTNLSVNMELNEVNEKFSPEFKAESYNKDIKTFILRYYLRNDSIVELEFVRTENGDSILKHLRHFTSNNELIVSVF